MRFLAPALLAVVVLGSTMGCSQSGDPAAASSDKVGAAAAAPSDPVGRVVYQFLDAVRLGNAEAASKLLTPLAVQRADERDENFAPPGSPTARFQVGAVELEANEAVVRSVWTDLDVDGKPYNEEIICVLRLCDGKWRVYGMAQDLGPGRKPMVMDFERPDMVVSQGPAPGPANVAPGANPPGGQPGGEIARNPFDQASQR